MKVYLAGPILHAMENGEHVTWRLEAEKFLKDLGHTVYLPLEMVEFCQDMGIPTDERTFEQVITVRDKWFSTRSDIILANFGPGGHQKASIGTCIELGWASAAGVKIIGVLPEGNVHNHPIVDALLTFRVKTLQDGLNIIKALGHGWTEQTFEFVLADYEPDVKSPASQVDAA